MAIESVSSGNAAYTSNVATQQTQQAQRAERPPEPRNEERMEAQPPKPVVNAEGQMTGSRINVVA